MPFNLINFVLDFKNTKLRFFDKNCLTLVWVKILFSNLNLNFYYGRLFSQLINLDENS